MNDFPTYLLRDQDQHVTVLSQRFSGSIRFTHADMSNNGAALLRFFEDGKTKKFPLTSEEADAFVMSWLAFRSQQYEAEQAEKHRLEEAKERAFAIAESCPAISVATTTHPDIWVVTLGEVVYSDGPGDPVYGPDELLKSVQCAKKDWDEEQRVEADVEKAHAIAAKIEGMTIEKFPPDYNVTFHSIERKWIDPKNLYSVLKDIANQYITELLNDHPQISLDKIAEKTADQKAMWSIRRDGAEVCTAQGIIEILHAVEKLVAEAKEAITN